MTSSTGPRRLRCERCDVRVDVASTIVALLGGEPVCPDCRSGEEAVQVLEFQLLEIAAELARLKALGEGRRPDGRQGPRIDALCTRRRYHEADLLALLDDRSVASGPAGVAHGG